MRRFLLSFLVILPFFTTGFAKETLEEVSTGIVPMPLLQQEIVPVIAVDDFIPQGEKILFDAGKSKFRGISEGTPSILWTFGDETRPQWGKQIIHEFSKPGKYKIKLSIKQGLNRKSIEKNIFVYSRKGLLIARKDAGTQSLINQAGSNGIWLKPIFREISENGIGADEELISKLQKNQEFIKDAELILFSTSAADEIQNFAQWWNKLSKKEQFNPKEKSWIQLVKEGSLKKFKKLLYPSFSILNPKEIFLIRTESLSMFFEQDPANYYSELKNRGLEYEIIDGRSNTTWFLPISKLTNYFVFRGVSQTVLYLLLVVPFIVFVISFASPFVGIKTFGVFSPLMLSLSFMLLGLEFGFTVFMVVLLVSSLLRLLFNKVELLYIPKVALLHSGVALSFFLVLGIAVYFNISINLALAIFPMMVMSTISEKFISAQSEGGMRSAIFTAGETVVVSFLAYLLVIWPWLQTHILTTPELIFLPMLGNVWLGRFTGLRLTEYFKFRSLFNDDTEE